MNIPVPKKIIKNGPATTFFWDNGKKTTVKRGRFIKDDLYDAYAAAIAKHIFGSRSCLKKTLNEAIKKSEQNNNNELQKKGFRKNERPNFWAVEKVIKNGPATVFFWADKTSKTVVKREKGVKDDIYNAYSQALAKKMFFNSRSALKRFLNKSIYEMTGNAEKRKEIGNEKKEDKAPADILQRFKNCRLVAVPNVEFGLNYKEVTYFNKLGKNYINAGLRRYEYDAKHCVPINEKEHYNIGDIVTIFAPSKDLLNEPGMSNFIQNFSIVSKIRFIGKKAIVTRVYNDNATLALACPDQDGKGGSEFYWPMMLVAKSQREPITKLIEGEMVLLLSGTGYSIFADGYTKEKAKFEGCFARVVGMDDKYTHGVIVNIPIYGDFGNYLGSCSVIWDEFALVKMKPSDIPYTDIRRTNLSCKIYNN